MKVRAMRTTLLLAKNLWTVCCLWTRKGHL